MRSEEESRDGLRVTFTTGDGGRLCSYSREWWPRCVRCSTVCATSRGRASRKRRVCFASLTLPTAEDHNRARAGAVAKARMRHGRLTKLSCPVLASPSEPDG